MKYLKKFENYSGDIFKEMKFHKIGDIISYEILYNYILALHDFDLDNKWIIDHVMKYSKFQLCKINLDSIGLDSVDAKLVDEYLTMYKETNWYPPILYDKDEELIVDGYHRAEAIFMSGDKYILAWCGASEINPFYSYDDDDDDDDDE